MINENITRWTLKEVLDKVSATATREEKAKVLQHYDTPHLRYFLKGAFDDTIDWLVPKGTPPYKPNTPKECDHVRNYIKKYFKYFVKGGPAVKEQKREQMFIRMLEAVDPEDAKLLCMCKDKELAGKFKGLTKKLVVETFSGLIKS